MSTSSGSGASSGSSDSAVVAGRGALFIGFAKGWFMVAGFVQQVLLTRIIGLAEFGAFAVVNNFISIVNNTVVQATIQSISKFTAEDERHADAVKRAGLQIQLGVGIALAAVLFLGAPLIAGFVKAPHYTTYFRIAALIPLLYALYAVFVGSANGLRRFSTQAGFDVAFSTAKTILLLGAAALWRVSGAFVGFAAAAVVILVVAARVMRLPSQVGGAASDTFPKQKLGRYMVAVVAYGLLLNLALNYDQPLLHHFAGAVDPATAGEVAARYQALRTLALLPYQALLVITFVIFPLVSRSTFIEDKAATGAYVTQTLRYALILAVGMGICLGARPA
ncbi:MAG TPA: oligosaccharide flippase family protein, partial [Polyangia bacterium]|nr:oligosaccharide flippase family protein [Polyangia bacterium]